MQVLLSLRSPLLHQDSENVSYSTSYFLILIPIQVTNIQLVPEVFGGMAIFAFIIHCNRFEIKH